MSPVCHAYSGFAHGAQGEAAHGRRKLFVQISERFTSVNERAAGNDVPCTRTDDTDRSRNATTACNEGDQEQPRAQGDERGDQGEQICRQRPDGGEASGSGGALAASFLGRAATFLGQSPRVPHEARPRGERPVR